LIVSFRALDCNLYKSSNDDQTTEHSSKRERTWAWFNRRDAKVTLLRYLETLADAALTTRLVLERRLAMPGKRRDQHKGSLQARRRLARVAEAKAVALYDDLALRLRHHAGMVCKALKGCLPRRELTADMLLPEGSEEQIDSGLVGTLGAFEIYRGAARGHRMANLRIIVR